MKHSRRQFLKQSVSAAVGASAVGAVGAPWIWAKDPDARPVRRPTLIVIYLRGGADPLSTIIPYNDPTYYEIRPTISIPHPGKSKRRKGLAPSIPLDDTFAMHPSMAPLADLNREGLVAAIVNSGSTHPTRSHFDAQDFMERAAPGIKSIQEGWLNRYLQATASPNDHFLRAFSLQPLLPRSLRGQYAVLAAPGPGSDSALDAFKELYVPCKDYQQLAHQLDEEQARSHRKRLAEHASAQKAALEAGAGLAVLGARWPALRKRPVIEADMHNLINTAGVNTVDKLRHLNRVLSGSRRGRGYPPGGLGSQLADIATIIKAGEPIEITAMDYNGWDHHSYQGGSRGVMANMLDHVSRSIDAFVKDVGPRRMKNVLILTMSEFGRTVKENGNNGSDHGHGGFMLAIGGMVKGGIYGKWTGLETSRLYKGRDLPVHTDFRDVFAETLSGLYRFDAREFDFFPGHKPLHRSIGFLREA